MSCCLVPRAGIVQTNPTTQKGQPVFVGNQLQDHLCLFVAGCKAYFCEVAFSRKSLKKHCTRIFLYHVIVSL